MSAEQAAAFAAFALVAAITPGPSNVMLTAAGAIAGVRGGLPCLLGVGAGMASMMFLVAYGLAALLLRGPAGLAALRWCGAALLLWLAWKIAAAPVAGEAASQARPVGFLGAAAFQWLNPKSWLVSAAAAGTYLSPGGDALAQALALAGLFFAVALPSCFLWLAFGAAMKRLLGTPRRRRAFNVAMGALLALSLAFMLA